MPTWCDRDVEHATVLVGDNAVISLRLERQQLDASNALRQRCVAWFRKLRAGVQS